MSANSKQKLKPLYIMRILLDKTDENHTITVNEIISELSYYDITAERKSIYSDIELLIEYGLDIICHRARSNRYFVGSRDFELPELKLLVDVVQSSKFITHKKSNELIRKIEKLTSTHEAKNLHRQVIVSDRVKTMNESIYYNVDSIQQAIKLCRKVKFKYFDYNVDKQIRYRKNGEFYCVDPYALTYADENYYLIAYHEKYHDISHFRVDRMTEIEVSEESQPELKEFKDFNVAKYSKKVFQMFSGEIHRVELELDNSLVNTIIDKFGKEVNIFDKSEDTFKISIEVAATGTFFGWLIMFGDKVKINSPHSMCHEFKQYLLNVASLYE